MASYKCIRYSDDFEKAFVDVHIPESSDGFYTLVYFHGGGLEHGGRCEPFIEPLVKRGIAVVMVQYRLYPEAKYPEYIVDCAKAVAWTVAHISEYGNCKGIYVGGSSAGGYISQMLCFNTQYLKNEGVNPMDICGYLHDAGQPTTHFKYLARERGVDDRRVIVDEAAPLYYVGLEKEYPRMRFVYSDGDGITRQRQNDLVILTLQSFKYDKEKISLRVMNGGHCAYVKQIREDGSSPFAEIVCDFIYEKETK